MAQNSRQVAKEFTARFNETLGAKMGKTYTSTSIKPFDPKIVDSVAQSIGSYKNSKKNNDAVARRVASALKEATAATKKKESKTGYQLVSDDPKVKSKAIEDLFDTDKSSIFGKVKGYAGGAVSGALDLISRPAYAAFEGADSLLEAANKGEQPWRQVDDLIKGAGRGITGHDKTGFGQVVEELAKAPSEQNRTGLTQALSWVNPLGVGGNLLGYEQEIAKRNPDIPYLQGLIQNQKRAAGFAGEIGLDPINLVGGGLVAAALDGAKVTKVGLGEAIADAVRKGVNEVNPTAANRVVNMAQGGGLGAKPIKAAEHVANRALERAASITSEIHGGAASGRIRGLDKNFAPMIAAEASVAHGETVLRTFESQLKRFRTKGAMSPSAIARAQASNPYFDEFIKVLSGAPASGITDDVIEEAAAAARSLADGEINDVYKNVFDKINGQFNNVPGIRVGNRTMVPPGFNRLGRAYAANKAVGRGVPEMLSHTNMFPGMATSSAQRSRAMGHIKFEEAIQRIKSIAGDYSREESTRLRDALEKKYDFPGDQRMQGGLDFLRAEYDDIHKIELEGGVRSPNQAEADNYNFLWTKGKGEAVRKFKRARKDEVRKTVSAITGKGTISSGFDEAKKLGLRPEEDAFTNLAYRHAKMNRDLTRSWFTEDILDKYGFLAKDMSDEAAKAKGLKKVKFGYDQGRNGEHIAVGSLNTQAAAKPGMSWYLPEAHHDFLEKYRKLSSLDGNNDEMNRILRVFDWMTNKFKFGATVMYPGFHVRNMIGDTFMGLLDGVNPNEYKYVWNMMDAKIKGAPGLAKKIRIANQDFTFEELYDLYKRNASSGGFFNADVATGTSRAGRHPIKAVTDPLRKASEVREDLGRFTHFMHALKEELPKAKSLQEGVDGAVYRVNKFKFDYGALTPFEKNTVKRVAPFYTYTRKVIPALLESMYLSPKYLAVSNRAKSKTDADDSWNPLRAPAWAREVGYARLSGEDEDEPWVIGGDVLPDNVLNMFNEGSAQGIAQQAMGQINPALQAIPEIASGRSMFNAAPIAQEDRQIGPVRLPATADYLLNKFVPQYRTGGTFGEKGVNEFLLGDRLGLGLSIKKITTEMQQKALKGEVYNATNRIETDLKPRLQQKGFDIYVSNRKAGSSIRIKDLGSEEIVFDGTLDKAIDFIGRRILPLKDSPIPTDED